MPRAPATLRRGRLTRLGSQVVSAGAAVTVLSFAGKAPGLTLVGLALLLAPVIALLTPTRLGSLVVAAGSDGGETVVGDTAGIRLDLSSSSGRGIRRFAIGWGGGGWEPGSTTVDRVRPGVRVPAPISLQAARHGVIEAIYLQVTDTGALGLATRGAEVRVTLPAALLNVPRVLGAAAPALPPARTGSEDDGSPLARAATRGDFPRGSRPFRSGDEPRSVSWRATARSGRLTVREWDPPQAPAALALAVLLPPARSQGLAAEESELAGERLLSAMASMATAAGRQGRELSLTHAAPPPLTGLTSATELGSGGAGAAALVRAMARVPLLWVAPLSALAAQAAEIAGPGGSVLLGVNLAGASWLPDAFLSCDDAVRRAGCTLEVVISHPHGQPSGFESATADALALLGTRCPVHDADDVLATGELAA